MADKNGNKTGGRKVGSVNKTTQEIREFYQEILEKQEDKIIAAFEKVAQESPDKFLDLHFKMAEYFVPKLARIDHTTNGKDLPSPIIDTGLSREELIRLAKEAVKSVNRDPES